MTFENPFGPFVLWIFLTLVAFRLQRLVTTDSWPPSKWFRQKIENRFGKDSSPCDFFTCPWCLGTWTALAVFAIAAQVINVPLPVIQAIAGATGVGILGNHD